MESNRLQNEIRHGQAIKECAEHVWGWSHPTGLMRAQRRANLLIRYGDIRAGRTVLELGCGTGIFTERLARTGADVTAIDISPDLLDKARTRELPATVSLRLGNAEALDFADGRFDAVVGSSVLHHLHVDRALSEVHRVLRPGGRLFIDNQNPPYILDRLQPERRSEASASRISVVEQFEYDAITQRVYSRKEIHAPNQRRKYYFALRAYGVDELEALLAQQGLRTGETYGDHDLRPYTRKTRRLIMTARKPG